MKIKEGFLRAKLESVQGNWRKLNQGKVITTAEGVILGNDWKDVGTQLEYLISNPPEFRVFLGGETVSGVRFLDFEIDWKESQIVESGELIILIPKKKKAFTVVWASKKRILQKFELDRKVQFVKSLTITTCEK